MKTIIKITFVLCAIAVLSCQKKQGYIFGAKGPMISMEEKTAIVEAQASEIELNFICNTKWKLEAQETWLSFDKKQGEYNGKVKVSITKNETESRSAKIKIYNTVGKRKEIVFDLRQLPAEGFVPKELKLEINSKAFDGNTPGDDYQTVPFEITANTPWTLSSDSAWLTILDKRGEGDWEGKFVFENNESNKPRTAKISLTSSKYPGSPIVKEVTQKGRKSIVKIVNPSSKTITVNANEEGEFSFDVKADGKWEVEFTADWLELTNKEYENNVTVKVKTKVRATEGDKKQVEITIKSKDDASLMDKLTVVSAKLESGRQRDSLALKAFYDATGGATWSQYQWDFNKVLNETNYPGAFFTMKEGQLRVTDLVMSSNNLVGGLPSEIGWLDQLIKLNLPTNNLKGTLPASLAKCTKLTHIDLSNNRIGGDLPDLSALSQLVSFKVPFNRFTGDFPTWITTKIKDLNLKYNKLDKNTCVSSTVVKSYLMDYKVNPQRENDGDASSNYKLTNCQ